MIENDEVAAKVDTAVREAYRILDNSAALVRAECSESEVTDYIQRVGNILCELIFKVMEPLYEKHPELKPDNWDSAPESQQ